MTVGWRRLIFQKPTPRPTAAAAVTWPEIVRFGDLHSSMPHRIDWDWSSMDLLDDVVVAVMKDCLYKGTVTSVTRYESPQWSGYQLVCYRLENKDVDKTTTALGIITIGGELWESGIRWRITQTEIGQCKIDELINWWLRLVDCDDTSVDLIDKNVRYESLAATSGL